MFRYKELKFEGETYTKKYKIDEILIHHKIDWLLDAEIENTRLEIINETLVWNAGLWYNGNWKYGVFRAGEWKYGTWENGVWYNGLWRNGTFKSGLIFDGKFLNGNIKNSTDIRGGQFVSVNIEPGTKTSDNAKIFKNENFLNYSKFIKNL
jgi:hypothetical protein